MAETMVLPLIGQIISIAKDLAAAARTAKQNRSRCQRLARDAEMIVELLEEEQRRSSGSEWASAAAHESAAARLLLCRLKDGIDDALKLVQSFGSRGPVDRFFHGRSLAGKLENVHEEINSCLRLYHLANRTLLYHNIKLLEEIICSLLRPEEGKELRRTLSSPSIPSDDKKEVFMWFISHSNQDNKFQIKGKFERNQRVNNAIEIPAGNVEKHAGPYDGKGSELNIVSQDVATAENNSATEIVEELRKLAEMVIKTNHAMKKWLPLVRSAKLILDFMNYLQGLGMTAQDVASLNQLTRLKRLLGNAYNYLTMYSQSGWTTISRFGRSSRRIDEQITDAQNKIDLYLEQLPAVSHSQMSGLLGGILRSSESHDMKMLQELFKTFRKTM
ncbi:Os12g0276800 [Oryza sativa Japonica Group]|uniref:Uncharacterized protein n=2 Tax=Oryza sativa subsp. japonica TaxID=39947 RepID=A0A8J8YRZ1_ORYSJ|nr:uncharacterized protein LOC107276020 [Oryza sativa Japonica Group]EEE51983.1 hypothetical protein OsJ_33662 [Oryza sativa Japonica Group]KAF2907392.1 hypothetical protein DAI22_12g094200 [Oryza sativa Japonica Group]BAT16678.1 Os12g0276800 [Oryza sativa Japonica Group]